MTVQEKAYLAGLLDGEGYFQMKSFNRAYRHTFDPIVCIVHTYRSLLEWLASTYGGKTIKCHEPRSPKHRQEYRWQIGTRVIVTLLPEVIPSLRVKRQKAEIVLTLAKLNILRNVGTKYHKPLTEEEKTERYRLKNNLDILNKVGPTILAQFNLV